MTLNEYHLRALRAIAHDAAEGTDQKREGWYRGGEQYNRHDERLWSWDHLCELRDANLVEWQEDYMNVWLRPTKAGWDALSTTPSEETRP